MGCVLHEVIESRPDQAVVFTLNEFILYATLSKLICNLLHFGLELSS